MTNASLMKQARRCVQEERYQDAIACYQQLLMHDGMGSLDMYLRVAWCYEQEEAWGGALASYQQALQQYQDQGEDKSAQSLQKKIQHIQNMYLKHPSSCMDRSTLLNTLRQMGEIMWLEEGSVLCEAGDVSDVLWILEAGELGVQLPEYLHDAPDCLIAKDGKPVLLGELGLFTHQRRSAKIWAVHASCLYRINIHTIEAHTDVRFQAAMHALLMDYWVYPLLSKHTLFERMNDVDRRELCQVFTPMDIPTGEYVLRTGEDHDGAYLLQQGCLFFIDKKAGEKPDVIAMNPGDMVHLGGLLRGYQAVYDVKTATPVRLLHLSRDDFAIFAEKRAWILKALVRQSRASVRAQLLHPDDAYLWMTDREIKPRRVRSADG